MSGGARGLGGQRCQVVAGVSGCDRGDRWLQGCSWVLGSARGVRGVRGVRGIGVSVGVVSSVAHEMLPPPPTPRDSLELTALGWS